MKKFPFIVILLFIIVCNSHLAQQEAYAWKNVLIESIYSEEVQDTFKLYIKLPDNYYDTTKSYPLLVLLDGDNLFPIAAGVTQYLEYGEHVPEMITVGIGYGTLEWFNGNHRSRDYTAHVTPGRDFEGGAPNFLKFLRNEFIPALNKRFRINETNLVIMGQSLGGQMVINTFVNEPNLFTKYIASSPFIYRWQDYFWKTIDENEMKIKSAKSKIFVSHGENEFEEEYIKPIGKLVEKLNSVIDADRVKFKIIEDGQHFIVPSIALTYGLVELFKN